MKYRPTIFQVATLFVVNPMGINSNSQNNENNKHCQNHIQPLIFGPQVFKWILLYVSKTICLNIDQRFSRDTILKQLDKQP